MSGPHSAGPSTRRADLDDRDRLIAIVRTRFERGAAAAPEPARGGSLMDLLTTLGRTLGFSFAAGVNLYATVAILGLASAARLGRPAAAVPGRSTTTGSSAPRWCCTSSSSSPTRFRGSTRSGTRCTPSSARLGGALIAVARSATHRRRAGAGRAARRHAWRRAASHASGHARAANASPSRSRTGP